ncbi:hypothetical protein TNCV_263191 [Trichonephila clavipes]|nr:hypothetical protein TNCV_263191 [Trichonephila clavipes]
MSFRSLEKRTKPHVQLLKKLMMAARGRQLQGMTDISSCRRKEADGSQQASLLSNSCEEIPLELTLRTRMILSQRKTSSHLDLSHSLQQRGDKCRGLIWPDAFTKGAYSLSVQNAASH